MAYAELHCLSSFSFQRGASQPRELVERAAALGYRALALTDECSVAGVVRAYEAARGGNLKLIIGSEFTLDDGLRLVLLATDRESYGALCTLITRARRRAVKGAYRLGRADLAQGLEGCLCLLLPAPEPLLEPVRWVAGCFPGRAWIAVELLREGDDAARLATAQALGRAAGLPLVAAGDVHMHARGRRALQDVLTAVRLGRPLAECGQSLFANGERHLRPLAALREIYPPALLAQTLEIAARCDFSLGSLRYEYPEELVPAGCTASAHLRALVGVGLERRFPAGVPAPVRAQVEHELGLIAELGYEHFFLTVEDLVRFARGRGILCQGRGSAANSAVCYALGITEVDPARTNLLFERFISRERGEPPDIDVDFEHQRREEVIQYVYEKYSREHAALAATVICYRPRSAIRDVGKALGLSLAQVDRLAKSSHWWDGGTVAMERFREAGLDPDSALARRLGVLVGELIGFPRHLSQHVGGFVISRRPVSELVPVENAAMAQRSVIQWDKDDLETLGLLKVDCLALGMLSAIRRALDLVNTFRGSRLTLANLPTEDAATYRMIQRADTVGVFQIESRAQMSMLPRLRPACFYDLVIEVAIVRPGPIQGGMVHPYLRRRQGLEAVDYPSPAIRDVLERTLGVPIFQEQVIKLAMVAGGFSAGEADQLRRAMAAWKRRGGLGPFEHRLVAGMRARGYEEDFACRLFAQIKGFGEYGFPESHSASFALLVYASAWLKCHEPAAFTAALLNSQPMGFYGPAQLVQDARRHGVEVRPADVCTSDWDCTLEHAGGGRAALRLGLRMIKGLRREAAEQVVALRRADRLPPQVAELARRARLERRDVECLAAGGALAALSGNRHQAHWQAAAVEPPLPLLRAGVEPTPLLARPSEAEDLVADYASLGLSLGRHPLALLRPRLRARGLCRAAELRERPHGALVRTAGLVINRQRPGTASGVIFVTLEDETGAINLVVWRRTADAQRRPLLQSRLLEVSGVLEREGEVQHLVAGRLTDLSAWLGELQQASRDFH